MTTAEPIIQRPTRGSRISTFYPVKTLPALSSLDSAFQLQEYISLLIRLDVHDVETITSLPGGKDKDKEKEKEKEKKDSGEEKKEGEGGEDKEISVDEACWIYEQLRRLAQDLSHPLITTLQQECSRSSCPEMKAGEWLYLCVAHGNEGAMEQCCAIDYILHTLDSATALLNSPKAFPSRLQIPASSHRHFSSLARRLGRIFAHAYFHHREAFEQAEAESSLYARFLALTSKFELVPNEFLVIPSHDEEGEDEDGNDEGGRGESIGLREAKLGTSFDHRAQQQQHQQQPSTQQPGLYPKPRFQPYSTQQQQPSLQQSQSQESQPNTSQEIQESPRKIGRNRTDTMVHSEVSTVVDDLAKAAAAAKAEQEERELKEREQQEQREGEAEKEREEKEENEREKEREAEREREREKEREREEKERQLEREKQESEERESQAKARESAEKEQREKLEAEQKANEKEDEEEDEEEEEGDEDEAEKEEEGKEETTTTTTTKTEEVEESPKEDEQIIDTPEASTPKDIEHTDEQTVDVKPEPEHEPESEDKSEENASKVNISAEVAKATAEIPEDDVTAESNDEQPKDEVVVEKETDKQDDVESDIGEQKQ